MFIIFCIISIIASIISMICVFYPEKIAKVERIGVALWRMFYVLLAFICLKG